MADVSFPTFLKISLLNNPPLHRNMVNVGWGGTNTNHFVNGTGANAVLTVKYPKGSYKPSVKPVGGIGFKSAPLSMFFADDIILRYQVAFANNFDPVRGGKLPGLFVANGLNKTAMSGASGGCQTDNASIRLMWRPNMTAEAYVYLVRGVRARGHPPCCAWHHEPC